LLPYYIASLNIEHEYYVRMGEYEPFEGICFADTLELAEGQQLPLFVEENTERVTTPMRRMVVTVVRTSLIGHSSNFRLNMAPQLPGGTSSTISMVYFTIHNIVSVMPKILNEISRIFLYLNGKKLSRPVYGLGSN